MAIDYDHRRLPFSPTDWQGLFAAVEAADPDDENEWIEFKAGVDPTTADGRGTLAKAIVAFANRDPDRARLWFDGYGVILIGLAPGSVPGTPSIDPAVFHDKVHGHLAEPAPSWNCTPHTYKDKRVIAVVVAPPQAGDPIACIGKATVGVEDGDVFVRKPGKSDRARAADIRRLEQRIASKTSTLDGITIAAQGSVPIVAFDSRWADRWLEAEEARLMTSLRRPTTKPSDPPATGDPLAGIIRSVAQYSSMLKTVREETRSKAEFEAEVRAYLSDVEAALPDAFEAVFSSQAAPVIFTVTNADDVNYEDLRIEFHVEGDVFGYGYPGQVESLDESLPRRPRRYGWWEQDRLPDMNHAIVRPSFSSLRSGPPPDRPTIRNGGSVTITSVPLHLRPRAVEQLETYYLVAKPGVTEPIRVTWTATATNRNGVLQGELALPVGTSVDLSETLTHRSR